MKLAVSNLAWDKKDNEYIFKILNKLGINRIETVLSKIDNWSILNNNSILDFKLLLNKYGIRTQSVQSLFFNIEYKLDDEKSIISHFIRIIEYSKMLGINILVFGSPNLRKLKDKESLTNILKYLDKVLDDTSIEISIEPNSKVYRGEFFFSINEIISYIEENNFKNIKTMIDTHNLILEGYDPNLEILNNFKYINHIHISEAGLSVIKDIKFHDSFSKTIKEVNYSGIVTYEVIKSDDFIDSISLFSNIYNKD